MLKLKQKGFNPNFPEKAELWKIKSEEQLPDWIIDRAKVEILNNQTTLCKRRITSGGYEILDSSGKIAILTVNKEEDGGVLYSKTHPLIYLTEKQLSLLYKEDK